MRSMAYRYGSLAESRTIRCESMEKMSAGRKQSGAARPLRGMRGFCLSPQRLSCHTMEERSSWLCNMRKEDFLCPVIMAFPFQMPATITGGASGGRLYRFPFQRKRHLHVKMLRKRPLWLQPAAGAVLGSCQSAAEDAPTAAATRIRMFRFTTATARRRFPIDFAAIQTAVAASIPARGGTRSGRSLHIHAGFAAICESLCIEKNDRYSPVRINGYVTNDSLRNFAFLN